MRNLSMILVILLIGVGCYFYFNPNADLNSFTAELSNNTQADIEYPNNSRFSSSIPIPEWYKQIEAVEVNSSAEISKLWQSKPRCCVPKPELTANNQEFFKSCYNYVDTYENSNQDIATEQAVVKCLWLMGDAVDKITRKELREYLIKNYTEHDQSTDDCTNCAPANTIVRVAGSLSNNYSSEGNPDAAIRLLEIILDKRSTETSDWVELETLEKLAYLYFKNGASDKQIARIKSGLDKFAANKDERRLKRRYIKLEKLYSKLKGIE